MRSVSLSGQSKQRQIVILALGGLILAGLLLFQLPRTLKMIRGEQPASETTSQPTPAPASPVAPATPVPPVAVPTTPAPARLMALTRFKSKDPFAQQINTTPAATASPPSDSGSTASSAAPPAPPAQPSSERPSFRAVEPSGRSAAAATATIAVNGAEEKVAVSRTFPKANPVFKLVSIGDDTVKVGVAKGTLKGGSQTVTLSKGEPLTLLNTVDGKRYKLELIST
jgi:hypothetical protein